MSKRITVTMLALLVATLAHAADPAKAKSAQAAKKSTTKAAAAEKAPRLTVIEPVKDYGTVAKGEKLDWAFMVKNTGDADLQIIAARPACGCTVTEFDKVIKPGATGKVMAHVDTTNFTGPISKPVTLETNDPSSPTAQLTINAIVRPYAEAYPAGFVRYTMLQGDAETQSVTLYSEEEEPFEITKVETPAEWVKVEYRKIDDKAQLAPNGRPGQNQWRVNITVGGPDAKVGPLADKIRVITNSKRQPDYFIAVVGVIRPAFRVEPSGINFGEVTPADSAATRSIIVRSNNLKTPEAFSVTKAEFVERMPAESGTMILKKPRIPVVATSVKPTTNKGEYEVTLQLVKDAKAGAIDGEVTIHTNDKTNPIASVPVKGTVKAAGTPSAAK